MSFNSTSIANLSDSDDESYEAGLARRRAEAEALLQQQEEKERLERQAHKEVKIVEQKRLEEEARKKQEEEETRQRKEDRQRDLAKYLEADRWREKKGLLAWHKLKMRYQVPIAC